MFFCLYIKLVIYQLWITNPHSYKRISQTPLTQIILHVHVIGPLVSQPCDIQYPEFPTTSTLCMESGINQSAITYQWEVAMPAPEDGVTPMFVKITDKTLFTAVDQKVLDSIYFRPFFQVCLSFLHFLDLLT